MTTIYFISGSVFILLSLIWAFVKYRSKQNKKLEDAKRDAKTAIDKHDSAGLFDALRRKRLHDDE